jgi:hypothetical protein
LKAHGVSRCWSVVAASDWRAQARPASRVESKLGLGRQSSRAETLAGGVVEIELVALDHEGDPAEDAGDQGSEVAEFHGALVGSEVVETFGDAVERFADEDGLAVELVEKELAERDGLCGRRFHGLFFQDERFERHGVDLLRCIRRRCSTFRG